MCVYMSIKDLGPRYLKHEAYWIPVAALRTSVMKKVPGQWSALLTRLLRKLLLDAHESVRYGITIRCIDAALYFKVGNLVADEDGFKQTWCSKGAAGTCPDFMTANLSGIGSKSIVRAGDDFIVDLSCTDLTRFHTLSDDEIWHKSDEIAAIVNNGERAQKEEAFGLNHVPEGLLQARDLRPHIEPNQVQTHDATHILFAKGLVHKELSLLVARMERVRPPLKMEKLDEYLQADWLCPRAGCHTSLMRMVFSKSRIRHFRDGKKKVSAFASEMMSVIRPLCHLLESHSIRHQLPNEVNSFLKLGIVVTVVTRTKLGDANLEDLDDAIKAHGDAFVHAYGSNSVTFKFYSLRRLAEQARRDGMVLDTFTCERKHSLLKEAAMPIKNTRRFERSVLARALTMHRDSLVEQRSGYINGTASEDIARQLGAISCIASKSARFGGTLCGSGDLFFHGEQLLEVICAFELIYTDHSHGFVVLVDSFEFVDIASAFACRYKKLPGVQRLLPVDSNCSFRLSPHWCNEGRHHLVFNV